MSFMIPFLSKPYSSLRPCRSSGRRPFVGFTPAWNLRRFAIGGFRLELFLCLAFGLQHTHRDGNRHDDEYGSDPERQVVSARQRRRGGLAIPDQLLAPRR